MTVGGGSVVACDHPAATTAQLEWTIKRAEGALAYGENDKAATELAEAEKIAGCLVDPADPALLARVSVLRGVERAPSDEAAAKRAFANAVSTGVPVAWDDGWPAAARAIYDGVAAHPPAMVDLVVYAPTAALYLDGRAIASGQHLTVGIGQHRVLLGTAVPQALTVDVDEGPVSVVVPSAYPVDLIAMADGVDTRAPLSVLLAGAFGEGAAAIVASDGAIWAATAGRTDWIALSHLHASPAQVVGRVLMGTGGAIAVGGGVGTGVMYQKVRTASRSMRDASSPDAFASAETQYSANRSTYALVRFAPMAGLAIAAAGYALETSSDARVVVAPWPGGVVIGVRW